MIRNTIFALLIAAAAAIAAWTPDEILRIDADGVTFLAGTSEVEESRDALAAPAQPGRAPEVAGALRDLRG